MLLESIEILEGMMYMHLSNPHGIFFVKIYTYLNVFHMCFCVGVLKCMYILSHSLIFSLITVHFSYEDHIKTKKNKFLFFPFIVRKT